MPNGFKVADGLETVLKVGWENVASITAVKKADESVCDQVLIQTVSRVPISLTISKKVYPWGIESQGTEFIRLAVTYQTMHKRMIQVVTIMFKD